MNTSAPADALNDTVLYSLQLLVCLWNKYGAIKFGGSEGWAKEQLLRRSSKSVCIFLEEA